jgi:hypothetical protein
VLGVRIVEPDCPFVGGVLGVVGEFLLVEGVPAFERRVLVYLYRVRERGRRERGKGQVGGRWKETANYSFVPRSEGSRCAGVAGSAMSMALICVEARESVVEGDCFVLTQPSRTLR